MNSINNIRSVTEELANTIIYNRNELLGKSNNITCNSISMPTRCCNYLDRPTLTPDLLKFNNSSNNKEINYNIISDNKLKNIGVKNNNNYSNRNNNMTDLYYTNQYKPLNTYRQKEDTAYLDVNLPNMCNDNKVLFSNTPNMFGSQHELFNNSTRTQRLNITPSTR
jgi:hypothetical protein